MEVQNIHIRFLADKVSVFAAEVIKSQSANTNSYLKADSNRLLSYLDALDKLHAWIKSTPELDLPKSTPRAITVADFPASVNATNESVNMIQDILRGLYIELTEGQSARMGAGILDADSQRLTDTVEHCRNLVTTYIQPIQPIDQPESASVEPLTKGS